MIVTHGYDPGDLLRYNAELRKDESNGWTKERFQRKIASIDANAWDAYARLHPEWQQRMYNTKNKPGQIKALLEFCSDQPFGDKAYLQVDHI